VRDSLPGCARLWHKNNWLVNWPEKETWEICGLEGEWKVTFDYSFRPYIYLHIRPAKPPIQLHGLQITDAAKNICTGVYVLPSLMLAFLNARN
jgi:hypothetical protein